MNLCLKWQTYYWSTVILYKFCLHCSYFDNEKRFSFCHRGNNMSFLNYFNYWAKLFRIKKNVSWYIKNIANALNFSKNNIIVFLLFYHNSIKIILCYKAEIKHLCTLGQFSQASGAKHGPQSDTNSLCRALHTRAASPLCPGQCGHWKCLESWGFHAPPALHHSLCKATNTSHPHSCRSCIWLRAATCVNKDCPEEQQNATQVWLK